VSFYGSGRFIAGQVRAAWRAGSDGLLFWGPPMRFGAMIRGMRSDALLSLAVNANVRLDDQEKALAYFEEAYELDQSRFMRVLLACYRARSGKREEAYAVLRTVQPTPALYYNLACTYALLGELDTALDFLRRELEENHRGEGSRRRQKDWARVDPDLRALQDDERFQRLVR